MSISSILNLPTHTMYRSEKVHLLRYLSFNDISLITVKISQENIKNLTFSSKKNNNTTFQVKKKFQLGLTNKLTRLCHKKNL